MFAKLFSAVKAPHYFHVLAPDVAALALSGDWAAEFLSGPESASAPGLSALGDAADADWTKEFIAEAAGSLTLLYMLFLLSCVSIWKCTLCLMRTRYLSEDIRHVIDFY